MNGSGTGGTASEAVPRGNPGSSSETATHGAPTSPASYITDGLGWLYMLTASF